MVKDKIFFKQWSYYLNKKFGQKIAHVFDFRDYAKAFEQLEKQSHAGKIIMHP